MHLACCNGHDKVVQVLLDHGVQVDVQEKVSNILLVYFKLSNTREFNNITLVIKTQNEFDNLFMKLLSVS